MFRRDFLKLFLSLIFILINPFRLQAKTTSKKLLLLDTVVAGFSYYDGERVWERLRAGDKLILKREPSNPYDEKAIEIYWRDKKLGYVPRVDNSVIAQMMDRGEKLTCSITWLKVSDDPWERIGIKIEAEV